MKDELHPAFALIVPPVAVALNVVSLFIHSYVISRIWAWHIEPVVDVVLNYWQCGGVAILSWYLTGHFTVKEPCSKRDESSYEKWGRHALNATQPFLVLGVAWLWKWMAS